MTESGVDPPVCAVHHPVRGTDHARTTLKAWQHSETKGTSCSSWTRDRQIIVLVQNKLTDHVFDNTKFVQSLTTDLRKKFSNFVQIEVTEGDSATERDIMNPRISDDNLPNGDLVQRWHTDQRRNQESAIATTSITFQFCASGVKQSGPRWNKHLGWTRTNSYT